MPRSQNQLKTLSRKQSLYSGTLSLSLLAKPLRQSLKTQELRIRLTCKFPSTLFFEFKLRPKPSKPMTRTKNLRCQVSNPQSPNNPNPQNEVHSVPNNKKCPNVSDLLPLSKFSKHTIRISKKHFLLKCPNFYSKVQIPVICFQNTWKILVNLRNAILPKL